MDRQMYVYIHVHIPRSRHTATPGRPMKKKIYIYIYIYMIHEPTLTKFKKFFFFDNILLQGFSFRPDHLLGAAMDPMP